MSYNFEATFSQPIITKLDNGTIKGAKDWANTITNSYIKTIKAGLPQGLPPTLPAPGLNPTTPPPYPIGASAFTTANTRKKLMYKVIYAYYFAKEISLDKGSIQGLAADVKQLITKIRVRTRQVKTLIQTIKLVSQQLKELPKILTEIVQDIKDEIKSRIEDLKQLEFSLNEFKLELGPAQFATIFAQELDLINKIKNFNPTNVRGVRELALFLSQYGTRTNSASVATDNQSLMKKYVLDKLFGVAKIFVELAKGVTDPTKILDFVKQLKQDTDRAKRLYKRVRQFDLFVRFLQPKLRKLEIKKKALIAQIKEQLQKKLVALRKKLTDRIEEFNKKRQTGKSSSLYKKATKIINDIKTKVQKQVKFYRKKVRLLQKSLKTTVSIIGKITSIITGLKFEFDAIKEEIAQEQKKALELLRGASELTQPGSAPTGPGLQINFNNLDATQLAAEIKKLTTYFAQLGLSEFANSAVLVMTQTKCNFQTIKRLLTKKRPGIFKVASELLGVDDEIRALKALLQELGDGVQRQPTPRKKTPKWVNTRINSLGSLLFFIVNKMRPSIKKIQAWIKAGIQRVKNHINKKLNKQKEDLTTYAVNLAPLKSDVQDEKDKKAEKEAKAKAIKERVAKIKKLILLGSYVAKMTRGALKLTSNIAKGNYKFSENATPINTVLDGLYSYRSYDQSGPVVASLAQEKVRVKSQFQGLLVIEALGYGLVEMFKDIKDSDFGRELNDIVQSLEENTPGTKTLKAFQGIVDNPPSTLKQFKDAANIFTVGVLEDASVATKILELEKKYLRRARQVVITLCDIKQLDGTKFQKTMLKVRNTLKKNQSFIVLAFRLLVEELKKFGIFLRKKFREFIAFVKKKLAKQKEKATDDSKRQLKKERDKKINVDAAAMSFAFGLAARLFWTGAQWTGPTGTVHTALNIGSFKKIKAKSTDGASKMIREVAKSFERQLLVMKGVALPPANTGIALLPFNGYK